MKISSPKTLACQLEKAKIGKNYTNYCESKKRRNKKKNLSSNAIWTGMNECSNTNFVIWLRKMYFIYSSEEKKNHSPTFFFILAVICQTSIFSQPCANLCYQTRACNNFNLLLIQQKYVIQLNKEKKNTWNFSMFVCKLFTLHALVNAVSYCFSCRCHTNKNCGITKSSV